MGFNSAIKRAANRAGFKISRLPLYSDDLYRAIYPAASMTNRAFYNLGAGIWRHPFWTNVDYASDYYNYDRSLIDIPWDITEGKPLPVEPGSAELCYCSNTVEHLLNDHVDHMFREAARILKPGGVLRVTTPNVALYYEAWKRRDVFFNLHYAEATGPFGGEAGGYTADSMSVWLLNQVATQLVQAVYPGHQPRYTDAKELDRIFESGPMEIVLDRLCSEIDFEIQRRTPGNQVNWWTNEKLRAALERAGFSETIISIAGGSIAPAMRDPQYFDNQNTTFSLFVDAVR
jgi:SAM-dependent methyltransferase